MWEKWMANSLQGTKLFFSSWCNWKGFSPWVWGCQLYVLAGMFYWWRKPKYFEVCTCFETWYPGLSGGTLSPGVLKWDRKSQIHLKSLAIDSCDIWVCCIDYFWKLEISPMEMKDFCQELSSQLEALEAFCFCGSTVFFLLYKHQPGFSRIWSEHRAKRGMDQQQKHAPRLQGHGDDCHDDDDDDDYYYYYHDDEYHDDDKAKVMMKITIKMKMKINIRIWTLNTMKKTTMRPAMQSFLDPEAPLIWWCTSVCGKDVNIVSTIRSMFVWILGSNKSIKKHNPKTPTFDHPAGLLEPNQCCFNRKSVSGHSKLPWYFKFSTMVDLLKKAGVQLPSVSSVYIPYIWIIYPNIYRYILSWSFITEKIVIEHPKVSR